MSKSIPLPAFALVLLGAVSACAEQSSTIDVPAEPYQMVYTLASEGEVVFLDLNSVEKVDKVGEAWSLTFLSEPTRLAGAPVAAQVYWLRARIDCSARLGQLTRAVGMENGTVVFDIPLTVAPTPLGTAWPLDEEFICKETQGFRVAATTFPEAVSAAQRIMAPADSPANVGMGRSDDVQPPE